MLHSRTGVGRSGLVREPLPLCNLANGEPIPDTRSWQALTLVEARRDRLPSAGRFEPRVAGVRAARSTDLASILGPVFDTTFEELGTEWRAHTVVRHPVRLPVRTTDDE